MVLPRPWDLAVSALDLWGMAKLRARDFAVEGLISDYTDAFLSLKLCQEEMGHLATRAYDGKWFGDSRVPFGLKMMLEVIEVADNLKNKKGTDRIDERKSFAGLAP